MAGVVQRAQPRRVVVGGGLAGVGEVLIGPMRRTLQANSLPLVGSDTEVVAAALGDEAVGRRAGCWNAPEVSNDSFALRMNGSVP
jgi:predicted NBD/HSP70 family sugar kinase